MNPVQTLTEPPIITSMMTKSLFFEIAHEFGIEKSDDLVYSLLPYFKMNCFRNLSILKVQIIYLNLFFSAFFLKSFFLIFVIFFFFLIIKFERNGYFWIQIGYFHSFQCESLHLYVFF